MSPATPASRVIARQQQAVRDSLPFQDTQDLGDVSRGLVDVAIITP
jgi:alkyl sulfatase BDS1-like metallo-beta-lactamase superfamily hydrolase